MTFISIKWDETCKSSVRTKNFQPTTKITKKNFFLIMIYLISKTVFTDDSQKSQFYTFKWFRSSCSGLLNRSIPNILLITAHSPITFNKKTFYFLLVTNSLSINCLTKRTNIKLPVNNKFNFVFSFGEELFGKVVVRFFVTLKFHQIIAIEQTRSVC